MSGLSQKSLKIVFNVNSLFEDIRLRSGHNNLGGASAQKTNTCFNEADCNNLRRLYLFGENYVITTSRDYS